MHAPRRDRDPHAVQTQRAHDKESKRARGALSCAECRRLKLKCDKTVPCSSCKRRGCSAICPNGSLITGQGTRFVLADTEKLHAKIAAMSDRIRQLEDALAILHSTLHVTTSATQPAGKARVEAHPLLHRDLLKIKSSIELHAAIDGADEALGGTGDDSGGTGGSGNINGFGSRRGGLEEGNGEVEEESQTIDAFGTLAIRDDGAAVFYGRSAGSESLLIGEASSPSPVSSPNPQHHQNYYVNGDLASTSGSSSNWSPPHLSYPQTINSQSHPTNGSATLPASIHALAAAFPFSPTSMPTLSPASGSSSTSMSLSPESGTGSPSFATSSTAFFPSTGHASPTTTTSSTLIHTSPPANFSLPTLASYLPSWPEALRLCELYMEQAPWFFGAVTRRQLVEEVLPTWYKEAPKASVVQLGVVTQQGQLESEPGQGAGGLALTQTPHDLALLFILLAFGLLTDSSSPSPSSSPQVQASYNYAHNQSPPSSAGKTESALYLSSLEQAAYYYTLTKAALGLAPPLERAPGVATVQVLALMAIYEGMVAGEESIERTWAIMGVSTKLAQSIGLHRDCARWKLPPSEVQKRRALFWELFITDCWQSLATGRLATFSLPFVDCELPQDPDQTISEDGSVVPSFPYWKARFGASCVAAVVQGTLTSRAPKYSIVLELDRKVRDMPLPAYAYAHSLGDSYGDGGEKGHMEKQIEAQRLGGEGGLGRTMMCFMPGNYRELTLLYIHRCFFAHALATHPTDPIRSQYAPSFLAGYRSACNIVHSVRQQFKLFPRQMARFWVLWTHAFSAAVMLASVVTHSATSKVAPAALLELRTAFELFEEAALYGGRACKFLPIIQRLHTKASQTLLDTSTGRIPPHIPNDIFRPSLPAGRRKDELEIFGGRTNTEVVVTGSENSGTFPWARGKGRADTQQQRAMGCMSGGAGGVFAGVHKSLVEELRAFDEQLQRRIKEAWGGHNITEPGRGEVAVFHPPIQGQMQGEEYDMEVGQAAEMERVEMEQQRMYQERQRQEQLHQRRQEEQILHDQQQQQIKEAQEREQHRVQEREQHRVHAQVQAREHQKVHEETRRQQRTREERLELELELELEHQRAGQQQQHHQVHHYQHQRRVSQSHTQVHHSDHRTHTHAPFQSAHQPHAQPENLYNHHQHSNEADHVPVIVPVEATLSCIQAPHRPENPLVHSRPILSEIQHAYGQEQSPPNHGHPQRAEPQIQHQSAYTAPHEYHQHQSSLEGISPVTPALSHRFFVGNVPEQYYENVRAEHVYAQMETEQELEQTQQEHAHHEAHGYWPMHGQETDHAPYPSTEQVAVQVHGSGQHHHHQPQHHHNHHHTHLSRHPQQQQHQYYTPDAALRGIAADDKSLQETWQSYMYKVGSPRQFFED